METPKLAEVMGLEGLALEVSRLRKAIRHVAEEGALENTGRDWPLREGHFCQYGRRRTGMIDADVSRFRGIFFGRKLRDV